MSHVNKSVITAVVYCILIFFFPWCGAQNGTWFKTETPRFRNANSVWMLSASNLVCAGGWLTNDSLTGIYASKDSGKTWDFRLDDLGSQLYDLYFTTNTLGYACGKKGRFVKTLDGGNTWIYANASAYVNMVFRSITFVGKDTCFVVGGSVVGNKTLIVFSPDKGNTWKTVLDSSLGTLIHITRAPNGTLWACGNNGLLYFSKNVGNTWERKYIPSKAYKLSLNGLQMVTNDLGFIVGGSLTGDSVQYALKTIDAGKTWLAVRDSVGPAYRAVYFYNPTEAYLVGNKGTIQYTANAGNTWTNVPISKSINDDRNLMDVFFINKFNGFAGGEGGKTLHYVDKNGASPNIKLSKIVTTTDQKTRFIGTLNPAGTNCNLEIHYGPDLDMKNTITVGTYSGLDIINLNPSYSFAKGFYYGKFVVWSNGNKFESDYFNFYAGPSEIPNFNFELWNQSTLEILKNWDVNGIYSKYAFNASKKGIKIKAQPNAVGPGAVLYGKASNNGLIGGIPFKSKPKAVSLRCRYSISVGDSAFLYFSLKNKFGKTVYQSIPKWTGKKLQDTTLTFSLQVPDTATVDTLILAWVGSNIFTGKIDTASTLYLDSMWFTGIVETIPNMGFNQWKTDTSYKPESWYDPSAIFNNMQTVYRSSYARDGKYSAHFKYSADAKNYPSLYTSKPLKNNSNRPSFAISRRYRTLHGYVHFNQKDASDTFIVRTALYKNQLPIGWAESIITTGTKLFTPFIATYNYNGTEIPDSSSIEMYIFNSKRTGNPSQSEAWVDQLSFENFLDTFVSAKPIVSELGLKIFPNPCNGNLFFALDKPDIPAQVSIYSIAGVKQMQFTIKNTMQLVNLQSLASGSYLLLITTRNQKKSLKIIINQ